MIPIHRMRRLAAALPAVLVLALAACAQEYPNSTFNHTTEFNTAIDELWDKLLGFGTLVFVLVEAVLIYTVIKFRRREGQAEPKHVHGNTTLEILWTVIPALILVFIAVPTVRTIFVTQAKAVPEALDVEVVGHQWWWEFRYPEFTTTGANGRVDTLVTANELYIPKGRTVNFILRTQDVLHSFWIPQMGGKRDLISNHTNYLWFTPDSALDGTVWNGFCVEYCGASHANMKFRAFTLDPAEFEAWVQHQLTPAMVVARMPNGAEFPAPSPASPGTRPPGRPVPDPAGDTVAGRATAAPQPGDPIVPSDVPLVLTQPAAQSAAVGPVLGGLAAGEQTLTEAHRRAGATVPGPTAMYTVPQAQMPAWAIPTTPLPSTVSFPDGITGDATRGAATYTRSSCVGCHMIRGHPISISPIGPNLTHVGSRTTLAAGMYPMNERTLRLWLKNSRAMKPGSVMPTLGRGQIDPITGQVATTGTLSDQDIADIAAYLLSLK